MPGGGNVASACPQADQDVGAAADEVQTITTLDELDTWLELVDRAAAVSDDEMRRVFSGFRMELEDRAIDEPFSDSYRAHQFELYRRIANSTYTVENEHSGFEVDPKRPFPYYTESWQTVSNQLLAIGFLIQTMALPSRASVLEFGPGWGNTTIQLARMGYDVEAVDIDPTFVQLIADRAALIDVPVNVRTGTFLDVGLLDKEYDAVLFFECFHHCSDHRALLTDLQDRLKPGGRVFLASEPIYDGFHAPWGLRLDGESLWAIRRHGWLELGFQESYFIEACMRLGWSVHKHSTDVTPLGTIFELRLLGEVIEPGSVRLPPKDDAGWALPDTPPSAHRFTSAKSRLVVPVDRDWDTITIEVVNPSVRDLPLTVRHGGHTVSEVVTATTQRPIRIPYAPDAGDIWFETDEWLPTEHLPGSADARRLGVAVRSVAFGRS